MNKRKYIALGLVTALAVFAADQLSKPALMEMVRGGPLDIAPFFRLVMVWNYGVSFGMLAHPAHATLLTGIALGITASLLVWLFRSAGRESSFAIGLIVGGALGNVMDRTRYGAVADFFYFHAGDYGWPAFNVADAAICIGVALLCLESMIARK